MAEPFLGEIRMFGGNFAPRGWAFCDGQILAINSNQALFALFGTTYGGDGRTTFGLPDLRGRVPMGVGQGPGLTDRRWGQGLGQEQVTLQVDHVPAHRHRHVAALGAAAEFSPAGARHAEPEDEAYQAGANVDRQRTGNTGGGQAHENQPPTLVVSYIVALVGVFPARN